MEEIGAKLGYWAIRGLAQRCRQLMEYCEVPYSQERYQGSEGRQKWFNVDKPKLMEKHPGITLPYLIDQDKIITESDAICTYICLKHKPDLLGRNPEEQVNLAVVNGVYKDFYPNYVKLVYGKYNEKTTWEDAMTDTVEIVQPHLKKFNGLLGEKSFFVGQITWIDFSIADILQTLDLLNPDILNPYPKLIEYHKRIWALPELQPYFSSQKFKERPCNNFTAHWK